MFEGWGFLARYRHLSSCCLKLSPACKRVLLGNRSAKCYCKTLPALGSLFVINIGFFFIFGVCLFHELLPCLHCSKVWVWIPEKPHSLRSLLEFRKYILGVLEGKTLHNGSTRPSNRWKGMEWKCELIDSGTGSPGSRVEAVKTSCNMKKLCRSP